LSPTPRFKAGVPACAEAALNQPPFTVGSWASEESAARLRRRSERALPSTSSRPTSARPLDTRRSRSASGIAATEVLPKPVVEGIRQPGVPARRETSFHIIRSKRSHSDIELQPGGSRRPRAPADERRTDHGNPRSIGSRLATSAKGGPATDAERGRRTRRESGREANRQRQRFSLYLSTHRPSLFPFLPTTHLADG
jgi:hypothetical protein